MPTIKVLPIRLLAATLLAAAITLTACGASDSADSDSEGALLGMVRSPSLTVGEVELLDVSGPEPEPVTMKAPSDGLYLVYFGYTSCPDICPTTMSDLSIAVNDLPPDLAERITIGMVTVDPDRDAPDVLAGYLGHFFDDPVPLQAADDAALAKATQAFSVQFEVADHQPGDTDYEVGHSAITYVVDDTGTVVVEWPFGFESEQMTQDLTTILET